ncbi:DPP IV N-terminal domain-containing protein [Lichenicoccus sp.]|uniref:S9 family peptidase n=1 Tax=Lichenicoccus sp. TaxID=2781899 RepID=UPI003D1168B0
MARLTEDEYAEIELTGLCALAGLLLGAAAPAAPGCFARLAQTRDYSLGLARQVLPLPDGQHVLYLQSGPSDTRLALHEYDIATLADRVLAQPAATAATLSTEEKARRQRSRMTLTGITDYAVSHDGSRVLVSQADRLLTVQLPQGTVSPIAGRGWIAPRLSPDGSSVAVVRDNDLHVLDLAHGHDTQITHDGNATLTNGLAEFAAAEELDRANGAWWSPDSRTLVFEQSDTSGVERHYIADPLHPEAPPEEFRYPRAGTANAAQRFGIVSRNGGAVRWIALDAAAWPYVARVIWPKHGPLTLVVFNRAETSEAVLAVDPATGATRILLDEHDRAWLDLTTIDGIDGKALPAWLPDGSGFLWATQTGPTWQLGLYHADGSLDHTITPTGFRFDALDDVDAASGSVVVTASPDRIDFGLYRVPLQGGAPRPLAAAPGVHQPVFSTAQHSLFADSVSLADGTAGTQLRGMDGRLLGHLPSQAETPPSIPHVQYLAAGPRAFDSLVLRPKGFSPKRHYPVVLSVYAGPGFKFVHRAPRQSLEDQCLADHGFIVVSLDGRGTPGRDHDFERATHDDLIDKPLADQIDGLRALAGTIPQMDLQHVGVTGWSFGGYFTAMAMIRRPDVFAGGVAGAPVVDFADYDTAYTERYLGTPQDDPVGYKASNVLTYAARLSRPLLILHGLTDDNVYFENTMKLTQALLDAGKPYRLILLPGTHLLPDPLLRTRVDEARAAFLAETLGPPH